MLSRTPSSPKPAPKGCLVLFGLPFLAAGLFFLWMAGLSPIVGYLGAGGWAEVPCTVLSASVVESHGDSTTYAPAVRYRYAYAGREYESDKVLPGTTIFSSDLKGARELVDRFPAGARRTCRVDPAAPDRSLLERRIPGLVWFAIPFSMIFVLVGAGVTLGGLGVFDGYAARRKARAEAEAAGRSVFATPGKKAGPPRAFLKVIGLVFTLVGGGVGYGFAVKPGLLAYAAGSWPEVPCVIEASSVGRHRGSKSGVTYSVDIRYRYEFDGRVYQSDRYAPLGGASSGYEGKSEVVARYPAGSAATCRVNPADPGEALLSRELEWPTWIAGGIGGVFFAIGLALLLSKEKSSADPGRRGRDGGALRPATGRLSGVAGMLFLALFWNGIVGVFVAQAVKGFQRGRPEWFLGVFLIPFLLVGLLILAGLAHSVLKCFAPRFEFEPTGEPRVGGPVALRWRRLGGLLPMRSATVTLEVREAGKGASRSRRGENTSSTYQHIIRLERLAELRPDAVRDDGVWSLALPAGLPPSLEFGANRFEWLLRVTVRDVFGLRYATEYPLPVAPGEITPASAAPEVPASAADNPFAAPVATVRPDAPAYAPGETVTGTLAEPAAEPRILRLGWRTEGDLDPEAVAVAAVDLAPGATRFALPIPVDVPPSYAGKGLSVVWTLDLCDGDRSLATAPLLVSPTRAVITTADYEPEAALAPWWHGSAAKLRKFAESKQSARR